jgi:hypothetical protein
MWISPFWWNQRRFNRKTEGIMHFPTYTKMARQRATRKILHLEEIMSSYSCFRSLFLPIFGRTGIYTVQSIGRRKTNVEHYYARSSRREIGRLQSSKVGGCGGQVIVVGSVVRDKTWRRLIMGATRFMRRTRNVLEAGAFVLGLILEPHLEAPLPLSSWKTAQLEDMCGEDLMLPTGEGRRLHLEQESRSLRLLGQDLQLLRFPLLWLKRTASIASLVNGLPLL